MMNSVYIINIYIYMYINESCTLHSVCVCKLGKISLYINIIYTNYKLKHIIQKMGLQDT